MTRPAANGNAGRVLVVEDDEGIREMLKYNLVTAGFSVHEASDGAAGLRTARTARPDLILLDLMLPGMSGFDFCRALRRSSRVPIIMINGQGRRGRQDRRPRAWRRRLHHQAVLGA